MKENLIWKKSSQIKKSTSIFLTHIIPFIFVPHYLSLLPILFLLPPQCLLCTYAIFGVVICPLKKVSSIYTLKHSNKTRKIKFLFVFVLWFFQNCSLWSKNILQWFARLRVVFVLYVKYDAIPVCVEESLYFHYTFFLMSKIKIIFIYTWCIYYSLTFNLWLF